MLGGFGVCPSAAPSPGAREAALCKGPAGGTSRTAPSRSIWGCHPWRLRFYEPLLKSPSSQASVCCQDLTHTPLGAGKVNRMNPLTGRGHPQSRGEGTWSPSPNTGSLFCLLSRLVLRGPKGWRAKSLPARRKRPHDGLVAFRGQEMLTRLVHSLPPGSGPARGPPSLLSTREGPRPGDPRGPEGTLPHSTQARTADGLTRDDASTPSTEP